MCDHSHAFDVGVGDGDRRGLIRGRPLTVNEPIAPPPLPFPVIGTDALMRVAARHHVDDLESAVGAGSRRPSRSKPAASRIGHQHHHRAADPLASSSTTMPDTVNAGEDCIVN